VTDFSFVPRDAAGTPVANRVEPGKRPRSSMSIDPSAKALLVEIQDHPI